MPTVVVFDCESDRVFDRARGDRARQLHEMQCTVACALVLRGDAVAAGQPAEAVLAQAEELVCWRDACDADGPFAPLLAAFDDAAVIVGFNQLAFDMPLLRKHYPGSSAAAGARYLGHRLKCLDIFCEARARTDAWFGLGDFLRVNALPHKSGTGVNAVALWDKVQMGTDDEAREGREALRAYCMDDVRLTAQLGLLPEPRLPPDGRTRTSNALFGIASALAAFECGQRLAQQSRAAACAR